MHMSLTLAEFWDVAFELRQQLMFSLIEGYSLAETYQS